MEQNFLYDVFYKDSCFYEKSTVILHLYRNFSVLVYNLNPLTPNDPYRDCTAPLTSKSCILYIYSTNTCTEYFKHDIYSPFLSFQNAVCFIILMYLVPVLFTFYIQRVLKFKKINPAPNSLYKTICIHHSHKQNEFSGLS